MSNRAVGLLALCAFALGAVAGVIGGWNARGEPAEYVIETPAPAVHYADGSVMGERITSGKPTLPAPKRPDGATLARSGEVTIQPGEPVATGATPPECEGTAHTFTCPPVRLRLDLFEMDDSTMRAVAKTEDGVITDFKDFSFRGSRAWHRNRIVLIGEPQHEQVGGIYLRDIGTLSLGAGLIPYIDEPLPIVAAGWSW